MVGRRRHLAYMSVWAVAFAAMSTTGYLGDRHPGQWMPFWQQACAANARGACENLTFLEEGFCQDGSGWACNEAGLLHIALSRSGEDQRRLDPIGAAAPFKHGCRLGFMASCENLRTMLTGGVLAIAPPTLGDYPIVLRGSKGPIAGASPSSLYARACKEGWPDTCGRTGAAAGP